MSDIEHLKKEIEIEVDFNHVKKDMFLKTLEPHLAFFFNSGQKIETFEVQYHDLNLQILSLKIIGENVISRMVLMEKKVDFYNLIPESFFNHD